MYEVVRYVNCNCGLEGCPGEKETVLFEHKNKPECINFMMLQTTRDHVTKSYHYTDTKDKIDVYFLVGKMTGIKKLRVQKIKKGDKHDRKSYMLLP